MGANCSFSKDEEQRHIGPKKKSGTQKISLSLCSVCIYIYLSRVLYVFKAHPPLSHTVYQQHLVSPCPSNHLK